MTNALSSPLQPVIVLTILSAIGWVMLLIWSSYEKQFIEEAIKNQLKFDRKAELSRIRMASFYGVVLQTAFYLGSPAARTEWPATSVAVFLMGIFAQVLTQAQVEKALPNLNELTRNQGFSPTYSLTRILTGWLFTIAGGLVFLGFFLGTATGMAELSLHFTPAKTPAVTALFVGGALGAFLGLALIFSFAPFAYRYLVPAKLIEDSELTSWMKQIFKSQGLGHLQLWVIEAEGPCPCPANAMVTGFPFGRGFLAPALFVTRPLLRELTRDELHAILCHEMIHLQRGHALKRLVYGFCLVLAACIFASAISVLAHLFLSESILGISRIVSLLILFVVPWPIVSKQMKHQELEADREAITKLGAGAQNLEAALRKMDRINGSPTQLGLTHPATEERIKILHSQTERTEKAA